MEDSRLAIGSAATQTGEGRAVAGSAENRPGQFANGAGLAEVHPLAMGRCFYRRGWRLSEMPAISSVAPARWVIFMDSLGLGQQISAQLRGAAHEVIEVNPAASFTRIAKGQYQIRPGQREDYDALIGDLRKRGTPPKKIVHLWSVSDGSLPRSLEETLSLGYYSLLNLARSLGAQNLTGVDIAAISNRLQSVSEGSVTEPARAAILGPVRVIPQDFPGITCRSIDCEPVRQGLSYVAVQIIAEQCSPFGDSMVAYRGDERWVQSLEPVDLAAAASRGRLKQEGVYLITGGLGDLGLAIAGELARDFHARIVLVDRTPLPPPGEWRTSLQQSATPEDTRNLIEKLVEIKSSGGEVITLCADFAQVDEAKQAAALARQEFGTINGVIHAAGAPAADSLPGKAREAALRSLDSAVKTTLALDESLHDTSLDFFALCSSAACLAPVPGQSDTAALEAFFDAFAAGRSDLTTVAIDSSPFQKSSQISNFRAEFEEHSNISAQLGAAALVRVLSAEAPASVLVSADHRLEKATSAKPAALQGVGGAASQESVSATLVGWWEDLLSLNPIGVDDDFFDLGGHSLIGVQLFSKIKKTYGLTLGLSTLFEARTIRQLAQLICQSRTPSHAERLPWSPLVPVQPKGKLLPIYVISGIGGNVIKFHSLAFHLGENQPIFGLLPRGLDGQQPFHSRIEEIAADYVKAIRARQPEGPYHLLGYSFGGIVAFEVAQQLLAQGGQVGILGLLDTAEWHYIERVHKSLRLRQRFALLREHFEASVFSEDGMSYFKTLVSTNSSKIKARFFSAIGYPVAEKLGTIEEINCYAADIYQPTAYPGKLTLFRCAKKAVYNGDDELLGWGDLVRGGVDVHSVPSDHFSILKEPSVSVLSEQLRSCLNRELPASPGSTVPAPSKLETR
ncbi:MAG: KR domain-containing protein [Candidatus Acidiferrales bacterium]